jgi:hypothetical protein
MTHTIDTDLLAVASNLGPHHNGLRRTHLQYLLSPRAIRATAYPGTDTCGSVRSKSTRAEGRPETAPSEGSQSADGQDDIQGPVRGYPGHL